MKAAFSSPVSTLKCQYEGCELHRVGPTGLVIRGATCGLLWGVLGKEVCGGDLIVKDWHPYGVRGQSRYEIICSKCETCDPNGWQRLETLLPAALFYFDAVKTAATDHALASAATGEVLL